MTEDKSPQGRPAIVVAAEEVRQGDPSLWTPGSFAEWEASEKVKTFLSAWALQMGQELKLRSMGAKVIFWLIGLQVVGAFGLVIAQGLGALSVDISVLKVLIPSVFGEVFGLGFVVTKYLFNQSLRHGLDSLAKGSRDVD
jgi:hypothetical protein